MPTWLVVLVTAACVVVLLPLVLAIVIPPTAGAMAWLGEIRDRFGRSRIDRVYDERGEDSGDS